MNIVRKIVLIGVCLVIPAILLADLASAVSADSLYVYDLASAGTVVTNQAAANTNVPLTLTGAWSSSQNGVTFEGNTTDKQSSSYAKPSAGSTIAVAANQAVGAAVIFTQTAGCGTDSQNISQIGFFATGASQIKLQLSKCSGGKMYPECRIAGALTPSGTLAVRGTPVLSANTAYRLECVKTPDNGSSAEVIMRTTVVSTNQTTVNTFTIPDTGQISSTSYLSVGNKYPLTSLAKNTDQYKGLVTKVGYCKGASSAAAQACLESDVAIPETPVTATTADEVKYAYGNTRDEVVFSWHGSETKIYYGLTSDYGLETTANASAITPVDITGPFMEARLSGLALGTTYHYKIGTDGQDYTFKTAAADDGSFKAVAIGDTAPTTCRTYQSQLFQQVASQNADFLLHHGDMSIANECGNASVHQYHLDIENAFSRTTAYMPVWGNHEYGLPTADAPVGTVRDSLANYKGRSAIPNSQTVPNDTTTQTGHPGCGAEISSSTNTCQGEDWGWFRSGRVLFISVPELWPNAITDWATKAGAIMQQAQNDPTVDYIVTYGHRPLLSSTSYAMPTGYEAAFATLSAAYAPSTANPSGKYVLNLTGHRHNMEVFDNYQGITHVVNGGGGQGFLGFDTILDGSTFRMKHLGYSTLEYNAETHELTFSMICGPSATGETSTCTPNQVIYTKTFTRPATNPEPPVQNPASLNLTATDNASQREPGETYSYQVQITNQGDESATNTVVSTTLPDTLDIVNADGGQVNGQQVSWQLGDLTGGASVVRTLAVTVDQTATSGEAIETLFEANSDVTACGSASVCYATDLNTVYVTPPVPPLTEFVTNKSVEESLTGWTGTYGGSSAVSIARSSEASYDGLWSIKVLGLTGASNLNSGFNDGSTLLPSMTIGKTYNASVWVKPSMNAQQIVLRLREWNGTTLVTDNKVTLTAQGTGWQQITGQLTAAQNGTKFAYIVYAGDLDAGEYFYADNFSLTTAN